MKQEFDVVTYVGDMIHGNVSGVVNQEPVIDQVIVAATDCRALQSIRGRKAIRVTSIRDPVEARQLRAIADLVIYEITSRTTEKELRRVIDNHLCDMLLGLEQFEIRAGLHSQKILFNHVIARICATHNIAIILNLRPLLFDRVTSYQSERLRYIAQICITCEAPLLGATLARTELEARNPADLQCVVSSLLTPPIVDARYI